MLNFTATCLEAAGKSYKLVETCECEFIGEEERIKCFATDGARDEEYGVIKEVGCYVAAGAGVIAAAVTQIEIVGCFVAET